MKLILVAFPVAESMRVFMRTMVSGQPMPSLYRTGAKNLPCAECGMTLNVGPRLQEKMTSEPDARVVCPICLAYVAEKAGVNLEDDVKVHSLGNPEAGWEGEKKGS